MLFIEKLGRCFFSKTLKHQKQCKIEPIYSIKAVAKSISEKIKYWVEKINSEETSEKVKKMFTPRYAEITPYLVSVIFILLFFFNLDFRADFSKFSKDGRISPMYFLIGPGVIVSVFAAFTNRTITRKEKKLILLFLLLMNYFVASYALLEAKEWLIIFPLINFLSIFISMLFFRLELITEEVISDTQAKREEIVLSTIFLIIFFLISQYIFNHHWIITFSICLVYVTLFVDLSDKIIFQTLFKRNKNQGSINSISSKKHSLPIK